MKMLLFGLSGLSLNVGFGFSDPEALGSARSEDGEFVFPGSTEQGERNEEATGRLWYFRLVLLFVELT
jgi:hypothetical protein